MNSIIFYYLLFIIYSFLGWCMEVIVCGIPSRKFVNRGFLIGPYCPIYGCAAIFMVLILHQYKDDLFILFVVSAVICTFLEYVTSFAMEKLFHARWWDYSNKKFNINGRVCLVNSMYFGILGCLLVHWVNPFFKSLLLTIPSIILNISGLFLFAIFIIDNIISFNIISKFKVATDTVRKDNTEEITEKIKGILEQKSILYKRLLHAYPNMKSMLIKKKEKIKEFMNNTEEDLKNAVSKKSSELKELQEDLQKFIDEKQSKLKDLLNKDDENEKN